MGVFNRFADAATFDNLSTLKAALDFNSGGTFAEREARERALLIEDAKDDGFAGALAQGVGTLAGFAVPGGAAVRGYKAANAAIKAAPMVASRLGMAGKTAKQLTFGSPDKLGVVGRSLSLGKRVGGVGVVGVTTDNAYKNQGTAPAEEAAIMASAASPKRAPESQQSALAKAARMAFNAVEDATPEDFISQQLTGNGRITPGNLDKVLTTYAAANSNKQRIDTPERAGSALLEEIDNEVAAAAGDPNITPNQLEVMRAKRLKILMGLSGIDTTTMGLDAQGVE